MIRLRSSAASARQARLRSSAASARQARVRSCAATAWQALRLASLAQGRARLGFAAAYTLAFVVTGGGSTVFACPVCFGAEETSMIDGTKLGIMVLLAITLGVQGAFAGFFLYLRKRAKHIAEIELDTEWSELQRGASRTS